MNGDKKFLADLFGVDENDVSIYEKTREIYEYVGGESRYDECRMKFIDNKLAERKGQNINLKVFCTKLTCKEEKYFSDILFSKICNIRSTYSSSVIIDFKEMKKRASMSKKEIITIINGLVEERIEVRQPNYTELDFVSIHNIFEGYETAQYLNSEDSYCRLSISQDFINACLEVKSDKQKKRK